jgi:hypothetical protein
VARLGRRVRSLHVLVPSRNRVDLRRRAGHAGQQSGINWHGVGAVGLVDALNERKARYSGMGQLHHTEELTYYDECEGGFYTITADLDARDGDVSYAELSLQLAGVPFDREPLDELCRTFDVRSPLEGSAHLSHTPVIPVALLIHEDLADPHDRFWVRGIVARNPFLGKTSKDAGASDLPWALRDTEVIVCDLRSWHPLSDAHTYNLERCRWTYSSQATVVRLVVDWPDSELPDAVKVGHPGTADAPSIAFRTGAPFSPLLGESIGTCHRSPSCSTSIAATVAAAAPRTARQLSVAPIPSHSTGSPSQPSAGRTNGSSIHPPPPHPPGSCHDPSAARSVIARSQSTWPLRHSRTNNTAPYCSPRHSASGTV